MKRRISRMGRKVASRVVRKSKRVEKRVKALAMKAGMSKDKVDSIATRVKGKARRAVGKGIARGKAAMIKQLNK